jgi:hypothetical protein
LLKLLEAEGCVAITWAIEDVQEERPDLNDEQAMQVLKRCVDQHDATIGINWETIEYHADDLFPT